MHFCHRCVHSFQFATVDEISHYGHLHTAFMESRQQSFVGRKAQMKMCLDKINDMKSGLLVITGKPGCGKTSLMVRYVDVEKCFTCSFVN